MTFASAGHPPGQLLAADGTVRRALNRTGRPLGRQGSAPYTVSPEIPLAPGDRLLLVTDGIDEAMRADGECFGLDRAVDLLRSRPEAPAAELVEALAATARAFTAPEPQADDLTIVVMRAL